MPVNNKYGVEKTNPDIVIIDSLSQFINFSQPNEKLTNAKKWSGLNQLTSIEKRCSHRDSNPSLSLERA